MTYTYFRVVDKHGIQHGHSSAPSESNAEARRGLYDRILPDRAPWRVQWQTITAWQDKHPEAGA